MTSSITPKLDTLTEYGLKFKAPALRDLKANRQTDTLPATVRRVETSSKLMDKAAREGDEDKLRALLDLKAAAKKTAAAVDVLVPRAVQVFFRVRPQSRDSQSWEVGSGVEEHRNRIRS